MPLHVVPPAPKPEETPADKVRRRVRAQPKPAEMLQCMCGSREMIETRIGLMYREGKTFGGTKQILCFGCLMRGQRKVIA